MKMIQVRVDDQLHKDFKMVCVANGVEMSAVVQSCMMRYIAEHGADVLGGKNERSNKSTK